MNIDPDGYTKLMNQEGIFIGYNKCNFKNDYNLNRCRKCQGYNHNFKKWTKIEQCDICAGAHLTSNCENKDVLRCINFINANKHLTKKRSTTHAASDIYQWESYKFKWNISVNDTNFPIIPTFPEPKSN